MRDVKPPNKAMNPTAPSLASLGRSAAGYGQTVRPFVVSAPADDMSFFWFPGWGRLALTWIGWLKMLNVNNGSLRGGPSPPRSTRPAVAAALAFGLNAGDRPDRSRCCRLVLLTVAEDRLA